MLRRGDKIKIYRKQGKVYLSELTISDVEPAEGGSIKVRIKEPAEGRGRPIPIVAVDKDGHEYEGQSWGNDPREWGLILRPMKR